MLKRLDRYLIGAYLRTFAFTVLIFSVVSMVVHYSEQVQRFVDNDVTFGEGVLYFVSYVPYINSLLFPLYALVSVIFFTSRLAGNSEILSMLNAGMSLTRIARPYMIAACIIAGVSLALNHVIVPYSNQHRLGFDRERLGREKDLGRNTEVHMFIDPTTKVYVRHFSKSDSVARDMRLETYEGPRLTKMLSVARAEWLPQDSAWRLHDYRYRTFGEGLTQGFREVRNKPLDTLLALAPSDFTQYKYEKDLLLTSELSAYIQKVKDRGIGNSQAFEIERQKRSSEPASILILTLIGLAIAGRKVRGGMGLNLVTGVVVGLVFVFMSRFSHTLANSTEIPAWIGVWTPNVLFTGVAAVLLAKAQR